MIKLRTLIQETLTTDTHNFIKAVAQELRKILPNVQIINNNIAASTHLTKQGKPVVRVDSKATAIWLKIQQNQDNVDVVVKTIVNNKQNNLPGYGDKMVQIIVNAIKNNASQNYTLVVDTDVSKGFWNRMEIKYPEINFKYI